MCVYVHLGWLAAALLNEDRSSLRTKKEQPIISAEWQTLHKDTNTLNE